jgi:hypothetical protein
MSDTCDQCHERISPQSVNGPIVVTIKDPEFIGPTGVELQFCSWSCASKWWLVQADLAGVMPEDASV